MNVTVLWEPLCIGQDPGMFEDLRQGEPLVGLFLEQL